MVFVNNGVSGCCHRADIALGARRSDVRVEYKEDTGVAVGDFDGDGDQDIFTGRNVQDYQLWWNDGKGVFTAGNR